MIDKDPNKLQAIKKRFDAKFQLSDKTVCVLPLLKEYSSFFKLSSLRDRERFIEDGTLIKELIRLFPKPRNYQLVVVDKGTFQQHNSMLLMDELETYIKNNGLDFEITEPPEPLLQ